MLSKWEDRPGEEWRPYPRNSDYQVSNFGRVRLGDDTDQVLTKSFARYEVVTLAGKTTAVHVLVLETFVGPRPKGMWACHNDGDRYNNRPSNLRWDTPTGNFRDREKHGRTSRGSHRPTAKIDESDVVRAWRMRDAGKTPTEIANDLGINRSTIYRIFSGELWKHVPRPQQ